MFLLFNPWLENSRIQIPEYMNQNDFLELFLQRNLSFCNWFGGSFGARPEIFLPLRQVWGFLCSTLQRFYSFFSVWGFKMEFNPLPDLLNTEFKIIKIGLFCVANTKLNTQSLYLNVNTCAKKSRDPFLW